MELDVNGKKEKVIPRDVSYNVVSEEPIHIDFMRIVAGKKIILEHAGPDLLNIINTRTRTSDWSVSPSFRIPLEDVEKEFLKIRFNKLHNPQGAGWLKHQILDAQSAGDIKYITLASIKYTNWLTNPDLRIN